MKQKSLLLTIALCAVAAANTNAQTKQMPIPAALNEVQHYNRATNTLVPLEKGKADYKTKAKGMGFGGGVTTFELDGETSPVRIKASDTTSFTVSMGDGMGDPGAFLSLYRASPKKGRRVAVFSTMKVYWGKNSAGDVIECSARRIGASGFEIIPAIKLEPGEYLIVNRGTLGNYAGHAATCFAFGVD